MTSTLRRALAMLLAAMMLVSCAVVFAGCDNNDTPDTSVDNNDENVDNGNEENVGGEGEGDPEVEPTYTYNASASVFPTLWNPHTYQTATDAIPLDYTSVGFYTFDYNETLDGYKLVPEMATGEPVDVTADYVGEEWGIAKGDKAKAWKIVLRDDMKWNDGTPITAHDFVKSAELLLNPLANNYRADSLYSGSMVIHNAKNYFYAGKYAYTPMIDYGYAAVADLTVGEDGAYDTADGDLWFNLNDGVSWSSNSLADYYNAGYAPYMTKDGVDLYATVLQANADEDGWVPVTAEVADALMFIVAQLHGYADADAYAVDAGDYAYTEWNEFIQIGATYPEMTMDQVGVKALSDTELVLIMDKELEGFYLLYSLTGSWLVKTDLYESLITVTDGVYNCTYGTSVETTPSYGPYVLTTFQADKQMVFEQNPNWYGYTAYPGCYQTTHIVYDYVETAATRLELFLQGKLDGYGLDAADMQDYAKSEHTYYTTGDSTFFIALNPDLDALTAEQANAGDNKNKTILTIPEFRMALSFALNRAEFCLATSPTNNAAFGAYSSIIISDPDNGVAYRTTEQAKDVLVEFWGLADEVGEGKLYADKDEAIESITGYNLEMGKQYFDLAYDKAIEAGLMDADDVVEIKIGLLSATSNFYNNGYDFLVNNYTEAVKGTKLEGKLTFTKDDTIGNGFSDALKSNKVDMLFGVGWTGSALDPYGLMEAYTSPNYQYDPSWDTTAEMLTININGVDQTASVYDWTYIMVGTPATIVDAEGNETTYSCGTADGDPETRLDILAALEGAILRTYDMIPIMDDSSASLKGMQIQYYTEEYIYGVGRGGIKYQTYNYTDAEWEAFVAENGGTLNYK